jgi:hypothetical protein
MIFKLIAIGRVKASFAILVLFYIRTFHPLPSDISILKYSIFEITVQNDDLIVVFLNND